MGNMQTQSIVEILAIGALDQWMSLSLSVKLANLPSRKKRQHLFT